MPEEKPDNGGGLFGLLRESSPNPQPQKPLDSDSMNGSTANYSEPLSPKAQRLLDSVPEVIGCEAGDSDAMPGAVESEPNVSAGIESLPVSVSPETFAGLLKVLCRKLAKWRDYDKYNIPDDERAALAGPGAQVLNALIDKFAPAFVKQFAVSLPGLGELALMSAFVFGPIIQADLAREEKSAGAAARMVQPGTSHAAPAPAAPKRGMIYDVGDMG